MCHRHTLTRTHGSTIWPLRTNQYSMETHTDTHTPNLMKKQNKSNFRELKSEHKVQRCEPINLDEKEMSKLNNKFRSKFNNKKCDRDCLLI